MSDRLLVGTRKGLFVMERVGRGWSVTSVSFLGQSVATTLFDDRDGTFYAALNYGNSGAKLHSSSDSGTTWQELPVPEFEKGPDQKSPVVKLIWSLEAGGKDQPGVLWAGTVPSGFFRSEDNGKSWKLLHGPCHPPEGKEPVSGGGKLTGIHSICIHPRNSQNLIIGNSCLGVWASSDGGQTWESRGNVPHPQRVVRCHSAPDVLWAQHRNGIFRSTDAGVTWQAIAQAGPSTFGFAAAVHPKHSETAWFVPALSDEVRVPVDARFVVTRTRDGGKTFDTLSDGLPRESAYDIVYCHALDVDESGKRLAVGSTTGGLWTTSNSGESWRMLPTRLPPIYCLRFAK